jgi:hypothetical protein
LDAESDSHKRFDIQIGLTYRFQKHSQEGLDAESDSHKRFDIGRDCKNKAKRDWTLSLTAIRDLTLGEIAKTQPKGFGR